MVAFDQLLARMADKWREVPGGSDQTARQFADKLLTSTDAELERTWTRQYAEAAALRGWYWSLYGELLRGKRVLEIGSGQGYDAIHLAACGVRMTCCDIAPTNLEIIRRIAVRRGLDIATVPIEGLRTFDRLPRHFDAIWAIGSIHHMPFEAAREESEALIEHLKPGGRWIELGYPRERWVREGSPPFDRWGAVTDGERTPWAEWYDVEKLRWRLQRWRLQTVLEHRFESDAYIWIDCRVLGRREGGEIARRTVSVPGGALSAPGPMWTYACSLPLGPSPGGRTVTVEIDCQVETGAVGFGLQSGHEDRYVSREVIVDARPGSQLVRLRTDSYEPGTLLRTRSATALGATRYKIQAIEIYQSL